MTQKAISQVATNDRGNRVGESHHNSNLSDRDIDLIRELNEQGVPYSILEEVFVSSKSTIAGICQYRRRANTPSEYVKVLVRKESFPYSGSRIGMKIKRIMKIIFA